MTSAFCRTLVLIAAGAALLAAGTLQADPVPASPELPSGRTSRVAPPRLAPDRFTAEGPLEAVAVPLDGWTVVWPGQKPEDRNASNSGITIARTNVVIGGQPSPALQFTFTRGTYKTRPLIELPFPFNADIWNVFAFKAKVETSAGLQPLGFGIDMPRYGYDAGWFNKYYDNFGVSVYDGKFDWTAVAVPTTHFLYHVDRHDPGVDGFKDFQWDMRYDDHSCNKGFVRDRAKSLRFFYETRNLPADATVVVTIAAPVLVKGAHIRFSEPERFAAWTNFAATYTADLSDSSRYLGPPATGRLAKPIPLARNGKALAEIVCDFSDDILIDRWFPKHAQSVELLRARGFERDVASLAARELKHWLDEITGGNFPLRLKPGASACPRIFLGAGFAKRHFAADLAELAKGPAGDGFAVREKDGDLYIFGACPAGTLFGVAAFLENNTDIIWAMLDKSGTVYTRKPNLDAVWGDALDKPVFVLRGWGGSMGIWGSRNRCNYIGNEDVAMFHIPGGHILSPQYYDFSEGVQCFNPVFNGKRATDWSEYRTLACLTDPDFAVYTREWFSDAKFRDNNRYAFMDGLDDNYGICTCPTCSAPITTKDGRVITPKDYNEYYSAWIFRQYNNLAALRDQQWPGYASGSFCYFMSATFPPIEIHPAYKRPWLCTYVRKSRNVPVYGPINQHWWKLYKDWTSYSKECHLYDYYILGAKIHPFAEVQQADLRAMRELGFLRIFSESLGANEYLGIADERWCVNRLYWNPEADLEQLHRYFNRRTYREAAPWIDKFRAAIRTAWYRHFKLDMEFEDQDETANLIRDRGIEQELRGYLREAYKAVRHPTSRYLVEKMAQEFAKYMKSSPIEGIPEPTPPTGPAASSVPEQAAVPEPEARATRASAELTRAGDFTAALPWCRSRIATAGIPEERRVAASADILRCLYGTGQTDEAHAWCAGELERAESRSVEMIAQYRVAFIRAAAKAGKTADTLALLREHRADRRIGETNLGKRMQPLSEALPVLIATDATLNAQRVIDIIRELGQDDLSTALGWTSERGRGVRASQVGAAADAFAKRGDDAMGAALLTWQATAEALPLAMSCANFRKIAEFWENRQRAYRAQAETQTSALAGLVKKQAAEADVAQAKQMLKKTESALELAGREGVKARKAWLALLAEASKKATTRAQRGEAFETLMMAQWDGLEPDERIRRVDRLINDAFLPDQVRYRNAMRIPSLYVQGDRTNWNAVAAHLLRAVKAGDWSGVPQRRFRDVTKGQDLRLNALCEVASQMAAAGQQPLARDMLEKGVAVLEYWADPNAVDLTEERAKKLDKALAEVGGKRPARADEKGGP